MKRVYSILLCILMSPTFFAAAAGRSSEQQAPIDLILIVDTSETMVGKSGGQDILGQVKQVLKELVDACRPGDNVVLISYDADVRAYPTALIYDREDILALYRQIEGLNAVGKWTYTAAAIQKALAEASRLDSAQGDRRHAKVLVLLTDGLNNPPPGARGTEAEVKLDSVARRYQGMPWFVWQVQFGTKIDPGVDRAFQDAGFPNYKPVKTAADQIALVREGILSRISEERGRQELDEGKRREEAERAARELREKEERRKALHRKLALGGALAAASALAAAVIVWLRRRPRPHGTLSYWQPGRPPRTFDLGLGRKLRLRIGPAGSDLALPGFGDKGMIVTARRIEGEMICVGVADEGLELFFGGRPVHQVEMYDRDEFQLGDYVFRYTGEVGARTKN